jgi:hypothetical protein
MENDFEKFLFNMSGGIDIFDDYSDAIAGKNK